MPWKEPVVRTAIEQFVSRRLSVGEPFAVSCRLFGISRKTGYKWWRRFRAEGLRGLRSRRGGRQAWQARGWRRRAGQMRRNHRHWGWRKLRELLRQENPNSVVPAARTFERWFGGKRPRRPRGPRLSALIRTVPSAPNEVLTVDFKGWFRLRTGRRVNVLTVRDQYSRFILLARPVQSMDERTVRRVFTSLFRRYGLPRAIWSDNGPPFGGMSALGLSRLSVWWLRLGIRPEFGRPARPGDNAAHEQMHQRLHQEVALPPAPSLAAQCRRLRRWVRLYNEVRPHDSLGLRSPSSLYRPSLRPFPARLPHWPINPSQPTRPVSAGGWISFKGRRCLIGRPFAGEIVTLTSIAEHLFAVRMGPHLLGHLHLHERLLRPAKYQHSIQSREGAAPPPSRPSPSKLDAHKPSPSVTR